MSGETFPPRFMRINQACFYLGVNRNYFNRTIRPSLTEISIGEIGVRFDRVELDDWAEDHKARNGRPTECGETSCKEDQTKGSFNEETFGMYSELSKDTASLEKALAKVSLKKRKGTSTGG